VTSDKIGVLRKLTW